MSLQREVRKLVKGEVIFDEPLRRHTSFGIGGPAEVWVEPADLEDLAKLVRYSRKNNVPLFIIGGGNKLLVKDEGIPGITVSLRSAGFSRIDLDGGSGLKAKSGVDLPRLVEVAMANGLGGLEFMVGIPGTVGGAVAMNAGSQGRSFGELVREVMVMDRKGEVLQLSKEEINFGYRSSGLERYIIVETYLGLEKRSASEIEKQMRSFLKMRAHLEALDLPNAGSIFKNPQGPRLSSGRLIELSGLGGRSVGRAQVWPEHCNFIVNLGGATAKDVLELVELIRAKVRADHSIDLELEVKVI